MQSNKEISNIGGIQGFSFIYESSLAEAVEIIKNICYSINTGINAFYTADLVQESADFKETIISDNLYQYSFTAKVAQDDIPKMFQSIKFDNNLIIAIVKDNNGARRLLGQKKNACELKAYFSKGTKVSDLNHIIIEMSWRSNSRAAFLSDDLVVEGYLYQESGEMLALENSADINKLSSLDETETIEGAYSYIILPVPGNPGKFKSYKYQPANFGGGTGTPGAPGTDGAPGLPVYYYPAEYDNGNSGASKTIDWNNGNNQRITLTANCTLTFTAISVSNKTYRVQLKIIQDAIGSRSLTFPATVKWLNDSFVAFGANKVSFVTMYFDGTNYYAIPSNYAV